MTSNVDGLVREGVTALKAGRKEEARKLLARATELDERNEEAWLWLSAAVDSLENQQICLENVLAINPGNKRALQGLEAITKRLTRQADSPPPKPAPPSQSAVSPFDTSLPAPPLAAPPSPAAGGGYHGSGGNVALPSAEEYDHWVEGLKLDRSKPPRESGSPFDLDSGPFQQSPMRAAPSDPFAVAPPVEPFSAEPPPVSPFGGMVSPSFETYEDEDSYAASSSPRVDPFNLSGTRSGYPSAPFADDPQQVAFGEDVFAGDMGDGDFSSASPFGYPAEDVQAADDLRQYFTYIPATIKATYLPGKRPLYPRGLLIGLGLVSVGVLVSVAVLIVQLIS